VLIGWLPPEAETRLLDEVTALSAAASRFAADFGTVAGQSEAAQQQNRVMTERWREHGLELDIAGLTYPGEHTDVAAHLQTNGWDTIEFTLQDLFSAAGLEPLQAYEQGSTAGTLSFVRARRK
jgi:O-methyltransferase involved in polyketide biosynthesis